MGLQVRNTKQLINPDTFKWKVLVFGLPGEGKTTFLSDAPNVGVAACEAGEGNGLLSVAGRGLDYVEPSCYADFDAICSGGVFKDKDSVGLDSLTEMCKTFIKDYAISVPRSGQQSEKRARGIPELDDYGIMGETTRRLLKKLIDQDKHIIVTATMKIDKPDPQSGQGAFIIGPDLPGQMFLGSTAMFDTVMCLKHRQVRRNPQDPKSTYIQRYFVTQPDGTGLLVKCRSVDPTSKDKVWATRPLLDQEEVFDPATGQGTFTYLLEKIKKAYRAYLEAQPKAAVAA